MSKVVGIDNNWRMVTYGVWAKYRVWVNYKVWVKVWNVSKVRNMGNYTCKNGYDNKFMLYILYQQY